MLRAYEQPDYGMIGSLLAERAAAETPRSGLHVSTIVNDMLVTIEPRRYARKFNDNTKHLYWEVGNLLEDALAGYLLARIPGWVKPAPRSKHGLIGSPDGWSPRIRCIDEIKCTWVSEKDFVSIDPDSHRVTAESVKWFGYLLQLLWYMYVWDAVRGRLHVLFINGRFGVPTARTWIIKADDTTKRANADRILQHARDRRLM